MQYDRSTLEALIQLYLDGLYDGDADKLAAIFHPTADMRWQQDGKLQILTLVDWFARIKSRPSARNESLPRDDFIITIDRSDEATALVKLRCQIPPRYFTDYLIAMKLEEGWQIVCKAYRLDVRE